MGKLVKETAGNAASAIKPESAIVNKQENIAGDVNVPSSFVAYHGVETNSAIVAIDNTNKAISVVVKPNADSSINDVKVDGESVVSDRVANIELEPVIDQKVAIEAQERQEQIEATKQDIQTQITELSNELDAEELARQAADTQTQAAVTSLAEALSIESTARAQAISNIRSSISNVAETIQKEVNDRKDAITEVNESIAAVQEDINAVAEDLETAVHDINEDIIAVAGSVSDEVSDRRAAISIVQGTVNQVATDLAAEVTARQQAISEEHFSMEQAVGREALRRTNAITEVTNKITKEAEDRDTADRELQAQIETIESRADVVDVVATKAELNAYDKRKLTDNDVIKVLVDESQDDMSTYYRYLKYSNTFILIGAVGPYSTATNVTNGPGNTASVTSVGTAKSSITNKGYVDAAIAEVVTSTEQWEQELEDMLNLKFGNIDENLAKLYYCNIWLNKLEISKINGEDTDIIEIGSHINSVTISLGYNKLPKGCVLAIFGVEYSAMVDDAPVTSLTITNLDASESLPIEVTLKSNYDGSVSKKTAIAHIANGIYYGVATMPSVITSAWIKTKLTYRLSDGFLTGIPLEADEVDEYIYYVCPSSYGIPMFTLSPAQFRGGVSYLSSIEITNDKNYTETYDIWRSDNAGLGSITLQVEKQ